MTHEPERRPSEVVGREPIRPGSLLHRVLQEMARAVAAALDNPRIPHDNRPPNR